MAAVGLLYVGAVLFVNGLSLLGVVKGTSLLPMNLFVGLLQVVTPLYLIFTAKGDQATIVGASGLFLFGFTYLYVFMNTAFKLDGTGLGWFSLFVAVTACVYAYWNFSDYAALTGGGNVGDLLGVLWTNWAVLWLMFWIVLGLGKSGFTAFTGGLAATQGIYTAMVPALILLNFPKAVTSTLVVIIGVVSVAVLAILLVTLRPRWSAGEASAPAASAPPQAYA